MLCDKAARPITSNRKAPLTLLDHLLAVIDPDPNFPYQSTARRVDLVLPAPDALLSASPGSPNAATTRIKSTRLIHFDGAIHAVSNNDRVTIASGALGVVECIGARAAVLGKDPNAVIAKPLNAPFNENLRLQMHLVDVPEVKDPATNAPLTHALLFVPAKIRVTPSSMNKGATLKDARVLLNQAAELWSPGHPGVPPLNQASSKAPAPKTKRYALVPSAPANQSTSIIRFRSFFPETTQTKPSLVVSVTADPGGVNGSKRPSTTDGAGPAATHIDSTDSSVARDVSGLGQGGPLGDSDGPASPGLELTHEIGHATHNLNDEYVETLDTQAAFGIAVAGPSLPSFKQLNEGMSDYRPYYSDERSMMNANHVPRLRHFWHHAQNLAKQLTLPQPAYDLVHETFVSTPGVSDPGTRLVYRTPQNNARSPWVPVFFNIKIPSGFGDLALFALGDDEGTVENLFRVRNQLPKGMALEARMQAVLVVRSRISFVFDRSIGKPLQFATLQTNFQDKIYDSNYALLIRFMLSIAVPTAPNPTPLPKPTSPSGLDRIAVLFQPHYSVDPKELAQANIVFDISSSAKPPRANPFQGKIAAAAGGGPPTVKLMATDFNFEDAWRVVLGIQNAAPGVMRSTDLDPVARVVETQLSEAANFRQVDVIP